MSLKPLQTHYSAVSSLYAPYTVSGGGGGSVSTFVTVSVSTIAVSSITGTSGGEVEFPGPVRMSSIASSGPNGVQVLNGMEFPLGAAITFDANTVGPAYESIAWVAGDGGISGLSTINGVAYPPAGVQPTGRVGAESGGNIYVPAGGATQTVANFSTVSGHVYELKIPVLRIQNQPAGVNAAGAWTDLTVDTTPPTYLDTFDMASVSTIANDLQKAPAYTFVANAANHTLVANGNPANTLSTAITIGNAATFFLTDLGAASAMPVVG